MKKIVAITIILILLISGCKKKERIPWENESKKQFTNELKENTTVIEENEMNTLISSDSVTLTFPLSTDFDSLNAGDVLLGAPSLDYPEGLLRHINTKDTIGGNLVYRVQEATLADAFNNYKLSEIDFNNIFNSTSRSGGSGCYPFVYQKDLYIKKPITRNGTTVEITVTAKIDIDMNEFCFDEFEKEDSRQMIGDDEFYTIVKETKMVGSIVLKDASLQFEVSNGDINDWFGTEEWEYHFFSEPAGIPIGPSGLKIEIDPTFTISCASLSGNLNVTLNRITNYDQIRREEFTYKKTPGTLWGYNYTVIDHKNPFWVKNNTTTVPSWGVNASAQITTEFALEPRFGLTILSSNLAGIYIIPRFYLKGILGINNCDVLAGGEFYALIVAASYDLYETPRFQIFDEFSLLNYFGIGTNLCSPVPLITGNTAKIKYATDKISNAGASAITTLTYKYNIAQDNFILSGNNNNPVNKETNKLMYDYNQSRNVIRTNNSMFPSNTVWNSFGTTSEGDVYETNCSSYDPFSTQNSKLNAGEYFVLCVDNITYNTKGSNYFYNMNKSKLAELSLNNTTQATSVFGYTPYTILPSQVGPINLGEKCVTVILDLTGNGILGSAYSGPYLNMP